jgi:hypothetical protein
VCVFVRRVNVCECADRSCARAAVASRRRRGRGAAPGGTALAIAPWRPIPARWPPPAASGHFPPPTAAPRGGPDGGSVAPEAGTGGGGRVAPGGSTYLVGGGTCDSQWVASLRERITPLSWGVFSKQSIQQAREGEESHLTTLKR